MLIYIQVRDSILENDDLDTFAEYLLKHFHLTPKPPVASQAMLAGWALLVCRILVHPWSNIV